jgi:hypothetical protein
MKPGPMKELGSCSRASPMKNRFHLALLLHMALIRVFLAVGTAQAAERPVDLQDPMQVISAYLRATYARDFAEAYRYVSNEDRKIRDLNRYVRERGAYSGFTLEAGKKLSEGVEITILRQTESSRRLQVSIKYRVPDPKKLSPLLLNWDPFRLNSLLPPDRKQLLDTLEKRRKEGPLEMSEGVDTFELVKEGGEWRVFLNWAAGVTIPIRLDLTKIADLDVRLSKNQFVVQPGDAFELSLQIKNKTDQVLIARIGHVVAPQDIAGYLDFVQCGFLLPLTLQPGKEQEYSGTYMLRGSLPEGVRQLDLTYDFRILK